MYNIKTFFFKNRTKTKIIKIINPVNKLYPSNLIRRSNSLHQFCILATTLKSLSIRNNSKISNDLLRNCSESLRILSRTAIHDGWPYHMCCLLVCKVTPEFHVCDPATWVVTLVFFFIPNI